MYSILEIIINVNSFKFTIKTVLYLLHQSLFKIPHNSDKQKNILFVVLNKHQRALLICI